MPPAVPTETWGEKLYAALPLFIVGGACLVIAVEFYETGATAPLVGSDAQGVRWRIPRRMLTLPDEASPVL